MPNETWGLELRGVDEMQRQLETLTKRALPHAAREMLNALAFEGRAIWQDEMRAHLTLRNQWTTRRALVQTARGSRMAELESVLGHTEDYMRKIEFGVGEHAKGSAVPIPSEVAAGQAKGSLRAGRKRAVRKAFVTRVLGKIKRQSQGLPRKARNARAVSEALRSGSRLALLEFERRKGIYRVAGGRRHPNISRLYDLTWPFVPRPRVPLLQTAIDKALLQGPNLALIAISRQLDRYRIGSRSK